ncbi:MAG: ribosomal protein S18-alanine N-acetyltransferase [Armatimonadetes bacterium]|nr:ribosomal protein S18-alanine N-acetyltransferase [Armatimonadota bacterium]NIO96762.1 ribosomal protein S18-alanine N-acetyltransferase [Armatimonadota bacterium]
MDYRVRYMRKEDIKQVNAIDREAFPTQWPPPDYRRELQNPLSRLIVVCADSLKTEEPEIDIPRQDVSRPMSRIKRWWRRGFRGEKPPQSSSQPVIGFASMWVMADEAHITNIAVRQNCQRQGIGEMLLMSIIDLAAELQANIVTLEVRVSNLPAQQLYTKYGFVQTGLRRGYYTDNREDALLMSTSSITSAPFQAQLQQLKSAHARKYGERIESLTGSVPA